MKTACTYRSQRGAALLMAMLTVALVATLSITAYWRQWQAWSIEQAERQRSQTAWLLVGALDWARIILREDARASRVDHLAEPWAIPLQESRLSSFVAADPQMSDALLTEAFLAGRVVDEQSKLNFRNLLTADVSQPTLSTPDLEAFQRLFDVLGLPRFELNQVAERLPLAFRAPDAAPAGADQPLPPARLADLSWVGLSPQTIERLWPYATWLPERTPLNLNTASPLVLHAAADVNLATAREWVDLRSRRYFESVQDARDRTASTATALEAQRFSVSSRYFVVTGHLRLDGLQVQETSLVVRDGIQVRTLWRARGVQQVALPSG